MRLLVLIVILVGAPPELLAGGAVTGRVVVMNPAKRNKLGEQTDVWVYLQPLSFRYKPTPTSTSIAQKSVSFIPRVRVIPETSMVAFPNQDRQQHNVFSHGLPTSAAGRFDLQVFQGGQSKVQQFDVAGGYVIYCDIHKDMVAYVKVVRSHWIAPVQNQQFKIENVPPGKYEVVAWRPNSDEQRSAVIRVVDGETAAMPGVINIAEQPEPPHKRKDGSDYVIYNRHGGRPARSSASPRARP